MKDAVTDRYDRLKRAAQVIVKSFDNPDPKLTRSAENAGCLDEFEYLLEDLRAWLDDDLYYEDVAWNMVNNPDGIRKAC